MPYAQTNYQEKQGINGRYTIAQIGCFITAFCNLEERSGNAINPSQLNAILRDNAIYIDVDDGIRDDVGWSTISQYDSRISVVETGNGAPRSDNSIVKFNYRSAVTGNFTTHFCLVASAANGTIIDSWDGKVKSWSVYGGPVAYASYAYRGQSTNSQGRKLVDQIDLNYIYQYGPLGRTRGNGEGEDVYLGKSASFVINDHLKSKEYATRRAAQDQAQANTNNVIASLQQQVATLTEAAKSNQSHTSEATDAQKKAEEAIRNLKDALNAVSA